VSFIAVTGSAGKTTTKDLIAAVLSSRHRGSKSPGTHNSAHWVSHTVLGARRGDGFCVHELGATGPGSLDDAIALVRPRIAVVTNVGGDHRSAFRTLDATAAEKAKVVHAVPRAGFAVLNADDPRVLAGMARGLFIGKADFAGAAKLYAQSVERNPQAGWYFMQLAHCYALLRDFERGETVVRRAIELQEEFLSGQQGVQLVGAHMRLGHLLALQEKFDEAADAFVRELEFTERIDHALRARIRIELHMRYGAALLGHVAAGTFADIDEATSVVRALREVNQPDPDRAAVYDDVYGVYRSLYGTMHDGMHRLAELAAR